MIKLVAAVLVFLILMMTNSRAKPRYNYNPTPDRHSSDYAAPASWSPAHLQVSGKAKATRSKVKAKRIGSKTRGKVAPSPARIAPIVVSHPEGCPKTRFCGCGVSLKVFGKPVRNLYLAANWLKFQKAKPAPGMVAARRGHVFYIIEVISGNWVLAYDPNSGRRLTRIHARSLAGFTVVNPKNS